MTNKWIVIFVAAMAMCSCSKPKETEVQPAVPVQVVEARRDSIQRIVTAEGILFPVDQANVMPKIAAPIRSFNVQRGDHVSKNQLLAVLENRDLQASSTENKELYLQAQSNQRTVTAATVPEDANKAQQDVLAAKQASEAAQKVYESRKQLFDEGALARRLVDEANVAAVQARSQYEIALKHLQSLQNVGGQEQVKSADAQTGAAKARYEGAQAQLSYSEVRSPIAGVIADRPLYPGEMASPGTALLTVMDVSRVIARTNIPVGEAAELKVGMPATIVQTDASAEATGKVTVVSPAVNANSTTVEVWVEANNPGERLKPGATVRVSIVAETIPDAVVVPADALLPSDEGGVRLMVLCSGSKAQQRKIEVGVREPGKVQIKKGVVPGEKVITVGGVGLEDGAKVSVGSGKEKDKE